MKATPSRRTVAREWLLFVGLLLFGTVALPLVLIAIGPGELPALGQFYVDLLDLDPAAWGLALFPYLAVQLVRSLVWAVRVTRQPK